MVPGEVNRDGIGNGLDVDPFVGVVLSGPFQAEADMNQDGVVNGLDVDPFVAAVVGGGVRAVPEPSTLALLGLAGLAFCFRLTRGDRMMTIPALAIVVTSCGSIPLRPARPRRW